MNMGNHNHGLHNQHVGRAKRTPSVSTEPLVTDFSALPSSPVSELVEELKAFSVNSLMDRTTATLTTLSTRNAELEREVKRLREVVEVSVETASEYCWQRYKGREPMNLEFPAVFTSHEHQKIAEYIRHRLSTSPQGGDHE